MSADFWIYALWPIKVLLYLSLAGVVGGGFCVFVLKQHSALQSFLVKYIRFAAALGVIASGLNFLLMIGSFSNSGLLGMFNLNFIYVLSGTAMGHVYLLRTAYFLCLFIFMFLQRKNVAFFASKLNICVYLIFALPTIYSFAQLGHSTMLPWFAQLLLFLHVLVMSLWIGSLYPLFKATKDLSSKDLQTSIDLFGYSANLIVFVLISCGLTVAVLLLKNFNTLLHTAYGHVFIIKIAFVTLLLGVAAINKWILTPRLQKSSVISNLRTAIFIEMLLALSVFVATSYITTIVGLD